MDRTILHCDMNAFYASVEELRDPRLRTGPMAVCGDPASRHGIILAKNEQAKAFGIVTAETVWQARKKCPGLMLVRPHHDLYKRYSAEAAAILARYSDLVEPFSIDESWLDVTQSMRLFGSGRSIADDIRRAMREELGLTCSVGVSFNKVLAKMGSEYKKPDATTVIDRDNFKALLWPMPVGSLFFVGKATAERLAGVGICTIGQLASTDRQLIVSMFGKHGGTIHDYANGIDDAPVSPGARERLKSVGNGITFRRNLTGEKDLRRACTALSDTVAARLRKYGLRCGGVKVDIKDPEFRTISRQRQLARPSCDATEISRAAMDIIEAGWNVAAPVRMLTITGIGLVDENAEEQLSIDTILGGREKDDSLGRALDAIRKKYGRSAIAYGSMLGDDDIGIGPDPDDEEDDDGVISITDDGGTQE